MPLTSLIKESGQQPPVMHALVFWEYRTVRATYPFNDASLMQAMFYYSSLGGT